MANRSGSLRRSSKSQRGSACRRSATAHPKAGETAKTCAADLDPHLIQNPVPLFRTADEQLSGLTSAAGLAERERAGAGPVSIAQFVGELVEACNQRSYKAVRRLPSDAVVDLA